METITINYDVLSIIVALIGLLGIIITHHFTKKRKIDELLFVARKEAYTEFMRNFGMAFGPEKIDLKEFDKIRAIETDYERNQRIGRIFAQCRLLANPILEYKLRHLYDLVMVDLKNQKSEEKIGKSEKDYIGYEIEALMRHDLHAIGNFETLLWQSFSTWKRFKINKKN
jgi:hypothetical protein